MHTRGRAARRLAACLTTALLAAGPAAAQVFAPPTALNTNAATDSGADRRPRLATDGAGTWIAVWSSNDTLGGTKGTDSDILFARSVDDGASWSAPAVLNSSATTDVRGDQNPDIATDGSGTWVVVWDTNDSQGDTIGTDGDILSSRSTDDGLTWSPLTPVNLAATDSGADVEPRIATNGTGTWVVVWESTDQLPAGTGNDRDIASARSLDGGVTWSAPVPANTTATTDSKGDFAPHIATDGNMFITVWRTQDTLGGQLGGGDNVLLARSTDGVTWMPPQLLKTNAETDGGDDFEPTIASDAPGHWLAAWRSQNPVAGNGTDDDILWTRSTDGGATWSAPAILNANATFDVRGDYEPALASRGDGEWIAVWRCRDTLVGTGGPNKGTDDDIVFARSLNDGLTWTMPAPVAAYAIGDNSDDLAPQVVTVGGLIVVAWESRFSLGGTIGTDGDLLIARGSICGDGVVGPGELCDDANQVNDDCCTNTCTIGGGSVCDDGNPCTVGDGCFGGECAGAPVECAMCETCVIAEGGCTAVPRPDCVSSSDPSRGQLQFKNKEKDAGDRVLWKLFRGGAVSEQELGDPQNDTSDHALCLWDESDEDPRLVFRATAPAGGSCNGVDCWKQVGPITLYKDPERTPEGIKGIVVRAGSAGRSQVSLKGKGETLGDRPLGTPVLPLELPARAQFQIRGGACWETRYTEASVKTNDESKFKAAGSE
jgi:cysteine-rich repeat protein